LLVDLNVSRSRLVFKVTTLKARVDLDSGVIEPAEHFLARTYPLSVAWTSPRGDRPQGIAASSSSARAFTRSLFRRHTPKALRVSLLLPEQPHGPFHLTCEEHWTPWLERLLYRWTLLTRDLQADPGADLATSAHALSPELRRELKLPPPTQPKSPSADRRAKAEPTLPAAVTKPAPPLPTAPRPEPIPQVGIVWDKPRLDIQTLPEIETNPSRWNLHELATRWWVSNQTDELLCLPYCSIERLDYQVRAALRVIGALRGRALLSDEVGLGKTIEAGLVLKEYLVRGMARKFLILTQPSLVDQWAEELAAKFNIPVATTHDPACRNDPSTFWSTQSAVVASLPLVRQAGHRPHVQTVHWDLLIVDEAHHLRNRSSLSWETVSALHRKFLLLLTATRSRTRSRNSTTSSPPPARPARVAQGIPHSVHGPEKAAPAQGARRASAPAGSGDDPQHPRQLGNPPPATPGRDGPVPTGIRRSRGLPGVGGPTSRIAGRPVLEPGQPLGSTAPPDRRQQPRCAPCRTRKLSRPGARPEWSRQLLLPAAWERKCALLPPIAAGEGGVVVFTQFLATQQSLAEALTRSHVPVIAMNGSTPAAQRQPMIEQFRRQGGALILTQSGTEGRNLQFCHRMVNFDLPWNPMEIEQRIGRLHRLGQRHPVRIHNFVQAGTLQEKLLSILQEKLNLFELVVGEAGLVLGDRFGEDDFADEVLRRWREAGNGLDDAFADLGNQLASARDDYRQVQELDSTSSPRITPTCETRSSPSRSGRRRRLL
jgi:superfamily II DNA or RNA helicase